MRQRSETWAKLAARGRFTLDVVAVIGGVTYTAISAPVIDRALVSDAMSVGNCISASMDISVLTDDDIASAAPVIIKARLLDGDTSSEWLEFGTFYIAQRESDPNTGLLSLRCYDAMLKASQRYVDPSISDDRIGWPKSMQTCVNEVAQRIGVEIDSRTVINTADAYQVAYPTNYTMQEVLGWIGAAHGGNWIITPENKLRLVPLISPPAETFDIVDYYYNKIYTDDGYKLVWKHRETEETLEHSAGGGTINVPVVIDKITTGKSMTISRVTIARDDTLGYTLGDDTGVELRSSNNPYANQAVCDDLYAALNGVVYAPFAITNACYDPCTELGDWILVGEQVRGVLYKQTLTFGTDFRADASAPGKDETSSEYPYLTEIEKLQLADESLKLYMDETKKEVDSQILQTREAITLEVTARQQLENTVNTWDSRITLAESNITAEVTRATGAETSLASRITITENNISLKVSKGDVSSQISVESGTVTIGSNRLIIESDNFALDKTGEVTAKGSFSAESGKYRTTVSAGGVHFYADESEAGYISGATDFGLGGGGTRSEKVLEICTNESAIVIKSGTDWGWESIGYIFNNGLDPGGCTHRHYFGDSMGEFVRAYGLSANVIRFDYSGLENQAYADVFATRMNGEGGVDVQGFLSITGDFYCSGEKNRIVETEHYGTVKMSAMESTAAYFADLGSATIDGSGSVYIFLPEAFQETIDTQCDYQVFLTATSAGTGYATKYQDHFVVSGTPGMSFDWAVYARQRGYAMHYMDRFDTPEVSETDTLDSIFYQDNTPADTSIGYMTEFADTYDEQATAYLDRYEQEVTNYDN